MFDRLWHDAVVGRRHEKHEVDAGCAGKRVVDKALVAGDVNEAEHLIAGQPQAGIAEVDLESPLFLLLEPIGVDAGQQPDQRGPARARH